MNSNTLLEEQCRELSQIYGKFSWQNSPNHSRFFCNVQSVNICMKILVMLQYILHEILVMLQNLHENTGNASVYFEEHQQDF